MKSVASPSWKSVYGRTTFRFVQTANHVAPLPLRQEHQEVLRNRTILSSKEAADAVFNAAVKDKYEVVSAADLKFKDLAVSSFQPKWKNKVDRVTAMRSDDLWVDWALMEKTMLPHELLDVPLYASLATITLRWKVVELRTRQDKFFSISSLMENHLGQMQQTYRNAYQSVRHHTAQETRGWFSLPSDQTLQTIKFPGLLVFMHARMKRDVLVMYKEDSFAREAKKRNRMKLKAAGKEFWKHDFFYHTSSEERLLGLKQLARFSVFLVQLPAVFLLWRGCLVTLEHLSLTYDFVRVILRGHRPVQAKDLIDPENAVHLEKEEALHKGSSLTLRQRVERTKTQSPAFSLLKWTLAFVVVYMVYVIIYEGRIPYYLVPLHEREFYMELYDAYKHPTKLPGRS